MIRSFTISRSTGCQPGVPFEELGQALIGMSLVKPDMVMRDVGEVLLFVGGGEAITEGSPAAWIGTDRGVVLGLRRSEQVLVRVRDEHCLQLRVGIDRGGFVRHLWGGDDEYLPRVDTGVPREFLALPDASRQWMLNHDRCDAVDALLHALYGQPRDARTDALPECRHDYAMVCDLMRSDPACRQRIRKHLPPHEVWHRFEALTEQITCLLEDPDLDDETLSVRARELLAGGGAVATVPSCEIAADER